MVHLSLYSPKGNQAARYFPYHGYLGLTPIKVEGVVRTKIDDDGRLLPASSITVSVRCYESRLGRVNAVFTNVLADYTQVLWTKPEGQDWEDVGDSEYQFRITVPRKAAGLSTAHFQDYKIWWRVEACVMHMPLASVGTRLMKHFDLPFIRYDLPPHPLTPSSPSTYLPCQTNKPRAPALRYRLTVPTAPVGPQDLVSIHISLQPVDHPVSIRSASLIVERRIQLNETIAPPSSLAPPTLPIPIILSSSSSSSSSSSYPQSHSAQSSYSPTTPPPHENFYNPITNGANLSPYSLPPSVNPTPSTSTIWSDETIRPLLPHPPSSPFLSSKTVVQSVAGVESTGRFSIDDNGVWAKTLTLQWPAAKSHTRWAMGENIQTDLASVKFFVRVKIIVSSPLGTESIDLEERELTVVSTNESERQLALSKYNDLLYASYNTTSRSKSKSPRRSRREREPLPSPPGSPDPGPDITVIPPVPKSAGQATDSSAHDSHTSRNSIASTPYGKKPKRKSNRRPHTSAGPSDKSNEFRMQPNPFERLQPDQGQPLRPEVVVVAGPVEVVPSPAEEVVADGIHLAVDMDQSGDGGSVTPTTPPSSFGWKKIVAPALSVTTSFQNSSLRSRDNVSDDGRMFEPHIDQSQIRAWEEEVARIEGQGRRTSKDIFSIFKRKRVYAAQRDG